MTRINSTSVNAAGVLCLFSRIPIRNVIVAPGTAIGPH